MPCNYDEACHVSSFFPFSERNVVKIRYASVFLGVEERLQCAVRFIEVVHILAITADIRVVALSELPIAGLGNLLIQDAAEFAAPLCAGSSTGYVGRKHFGHMPSCSEQTTAGNSGNSPLRYTASQIQQQGGDASRSDEHDPHRIATHISGPNVGVAHTAQILV
jgi:hypothetical protein